MVWLTYRKCICFLMEGEETRHASFVVFGVFYWDYGSKNSNMFPSLFVKLNSYSTKHIPNSQTEK